MSTETLILRQPDDWHIHLRDASLLHAVLPATAAVFGRAIVMPNLKPAVTTHALAAAYRARIMAAVPPGAGFTPLMTCYLTDHTDADDLARGHAAGVLAAAKLYPAGATTHSDAGVTDLRRLDGVLARMQDIGMPLLIHGEVVDPDIDIFDREAVFIERELAPLRARYPALPIVLEHVTTREGIDFVAGAAGPTAATLTPHHLFFNRNAMFEGGLRPHAYCLPVAKRENHRLALVQAATSGNPRFFLGTDSAPHLRHLKEHACGCAGVYNAPTALACYAEIFARAGCLERLEDFASLFGPRFYGLPLNTRRVELSSGVSAAEAPDLLTPEGPVKIFDPPAARRWQVRLLPLADDGSGG